ncbi:hypothetical protein LINPERPRIM_LOCUS25197 [Linum perenne]
MILFQCDWCDVYDKEKGAKVDEYGFVSVNLKKLLKPDEPFVLANQASQVFFVDDKNNKNWHVAMRVEPRDTYALPVEEDESTYIEHHDEVTEVTILNT